MRPCEKGPCSKNQCCHGSGKCRTITFRCCDGTVTDYLQSDQFENMFLNWNSLEAHAKGFWDYHSFITASAEYEPYGFGTTYLNSNFFGTKEVAAFLAHAGTKTSCEYYCLLHQRDFVLGNFNLGFLSRWFGWICVCMCVRMREGETEDFFLVRF